MDAWHTNTHTHIAHNTHKTIDRPTLFTREISFALCSDWDSKLPMWRTAFFLFGAIKFTYAGKHKRHRDRPSSEQKEMTSSIDKSTEPIYFLFISKFMLRPKRMWFLFSYIFFFHSPFFRLSATWPRPYTCMCVRCVPSKSSQEYVWKYMPFPLRLTVYLFGVSHYRPTERQMKMLYESNSGLHEPSRCDDISQAFRVYFICKFYTFFIRFPFPTLVITFAYSRCCCCYCHDHHCCWSSAVNANYGRSSMAAKKNDIP